MRQRLLAFVLGFGNLLLVCALAIGAQIPLERLLPPTAAKLSAAAVLLALYVAGSRFIERRRPVELRARGSVSAIAVGLALGIVLFSCVMAILWLAGAY